MTCRHTHVHTCVHTHTRSFFSFSLFFCCIVLAATSSIAGIACRAWNSSGDMQAHTHTHTHMLFFFVMLAATDLKYRLSCLPFIWHFLSFDMQAHTHTHIHTGSFFSCLLLLTCHACHSSIAGIACRAWNSSGTFFHNDMQAHTHTHTHMLFFFFIIGV